MSSPVQKLRSKLLERGAHGILEFGRSFNILDKNRSQSLDKEEFRRGLDLYHIDLSDREIDQLYSEIDKDMSGRLSYKEFLLILRPPLNATRVSMINKAFSKMDKTGDGVITVDDLKGVYTVKEHPKYISGEMTEDECFREFLDNFDSETNKDGVVTKDEFLDYYSGISAFIDGDGYFVEMMTRCWQL